MPIALNLTQPGLSVRPTNSRKNVCLECLKTSQNNSTESAPCPTVAPASAERWLNTRAANKRKKGRRAQWRRSGKQGSHHSSRRSLGTGHPWSKNKNVAGCQGQHLITEKIQLGTKWTTSVIFHGYILHMSGLFHTFRPRPSMSKVKICKNWKTPIKLTGHATWQQLSHTASPEENKNHVRISKRTWTQTISVPSYCHRANDPQILQQIDHHPHSASGAEKSGCLGSDFTIEEVVCQDEAHKDHDEPDKPTCCGEGTAFCALDLVPKLPGRTFSTNNAFTITTTSARRTTRAITGWHTLEGVQGVVNWSVISGSHLKDQKKSFFARSAINHFDFD